MSDEKQDDSQAVVEDLQGKDIDAPQEQATSDENEDVLKDEETYSSSADDSCLDPKDSKIVSLELKIRELEESLLRVRAEADNIRKRAVKDVEAAHKYGNEKLVREILPVRDSLEMGLQSAENNDDTSSLSEGLSLTLKMFADFMERMEVRELDPLDETFNPEEHQAMTTEYVEGKASGTIVRVFQKGYLLHGRLVRPALVVVSAGKADSSA